MKTHQRQDLRALVPERRRVTIWDLPTRLFHWGAVLLVTASLMTSQFNWLVWHVAFGEILLALVIFRLIWGLVGSDTSQFRNFLTSPRTTVYYLLGRECHETSPRVGHSPLGGWMVLFLIILLFVQTLSGLFIYNDVAKVGPFFGKFPQTMVEAIVHLHVVVSKILLLSIALHILAIGFYLVVKKQNLVVPMISGKRLVPSSTPCPKCRDPLLAICTTLLAGGIACLLTCL